MSYHDQRNLPSPEELQRRCLEVQSEWSDAERNKRAGANGNPPAMLHTLSIREAREQSEAERISEFLVNECPDPVGRVHGKRRGVTF